MTSLPNRPSITQRLLERIKKSLSWLGLVIKLIVGAMEEALFRDNDELTWVGFRLAFRRKSGSVDGLNPCVTDNCKDIDLLTLLQKAEPQGLVCGALRWHYQS